MVQETNSPQLENCAQRSANVLLSAALDYRRKGFSPIPVNPQTKKPAVKWAPFQIEPASELFLSQQWERNPTFNVGLVCGSGATDLIRGFFGLDYDDPNKYELHRGRLPASTTIGSGRDGGRHVWLVAPEPIATRKLEGLDIKGFGSQVVAPPSIHPSGRAYQFLSGGPDSIARISWRDLDFLPIEPANIALEKERPGRIPKTAWLILNGYLDPSHKNKRSRSELEHSAVVAMVFAGLSDSEIITSFAHHAHGGSKFRGIEAHSMNRALDWLSRSCRNARYWINSQKTETRALLESIGHKLAFMNFPGRSGATDKAVYQAFLNNAARLNQTRLFLSYRDIAEGAGITSLDTVAQSIKRLKKAGWLVTLEHGTNGKASTYELQTGLFAPVLANQYTEQEDMCTVYVSASTQGNGFQILEELDTFRHRGLGKNGIAVFRELRRIFPAGIKEQSLADVCNMQWSTINRKMRKFQKAGLAKKIGREWFLIPEASIEKGALDLGTAGAGRAQKVRHARERRANSEQRQLFASMQFNKQTGEVV